MRNKKLAARSSSHRVTVSSMTKLFMCVGGWLFIIVLGVPPVHSAESGSAQKFNLTSSAFQAGADIPRKYTCDGEDVSPPLRWENAPGGTKAFAMIADDPDAPGGTWVHWVIYDLPAETKELTEGVPKTEVIAGGAKQGINDFRKVGYGGPVRHPVPHIDIFSSSMRSMPQPISNPERPSNYCSMP